MEGLLHRLVFSRQMALILDFLNYGVPNCCIFLRCTVKVYSGILLKDSGPDGQDLSFHCYGWKLSVLLYAYGAKFEIVICGLKS